MSPVEPPSQRLTVTEVRAEAKGVLSIELRRDDLAELPPFAAGAHLELHLPNGLLRQYSLCSDPADRSRYVVAVGLAEDSRGGSAYIHRSLRVGQVLTVKGPRSHFPMVEGAARHVFIAGGIGITPMLAMIRSASARGEAWELHYLVRNRLRAAFLEEIAALDGPAVLHCDDEAGGTYDIAALMAGIPADAAVYCCGPGPLMAAVEAAGSAHPPDLLCFEYFAAKNNSDLPPGEGFRVNLIRSARSIEVAPEQSILAALEDNGIEISWACREGVCGSCEIPVAGGIPDHRDSVLTARERESNQTIITCVSRSLTDELVLDL